MGANKTCTPGNQNSHCLSLGHHNKRRRPLSDNQGEEKYKSANKIYFHGQTNLCGSILAGDSTHDSVVPNRMLFQVRRYFFNPAANFLSTIKYRTWPAVTEIKVNNKTRTSPCARMIGKCSAILKRMGIAKN